MTYILGIDQGTSGTKTIIFNEEGKALYKASEPLKTFYLHDGWVEQDAEEIYQNTLRSVQKCISGFRDQGGNLRQLKACGISNQRETLILWDKIGTPLYNAVVWQCKRSVSICERLKEQGLEQTIQDKTGLIIDPYFSATKVMWLYENEPTVRKAIDDGNAFFGTVDAWLLFKLTKGKKHMTDYTNASRTMFFNLKNLTWDHSMLETFHLSRLNLPEPKPSSFDFGETDFGGLLEHPLTVAAMIGDSHAAAFGEGCYAPGDAKATLGTGCSVIMNVGDKIKSSENGMVAAICWSVKNRVEYAQEGIIVSAGATIEWLKNELALFKDNLEIESLSAEAKGNNGVYIIPAFSGLGAPHWDMTRKASITGLTFDCGKKHIARAALESIPYQIKDVIAAMESGQREDLVRLCVEHILPSKRAYLAGRRRHYIQRLRTAVPRRPAGPACRQYRTR